MEIRQGARATGATQRRRRSQLRHLAMTRVRERHRGWRGKVRSELSTRPSKAGEDHQTYLVERTEFPKSLDRLGSSHQVDVTALVLITETLQ